MSPNMRQLEGMGVGSLMLTESSANLEAFFSEGKDIVTYSSVDELVEKALYYLSHEDERQVIAAQGLETCLKFYNMDIRAQAVLDSVERLNNDGTILPFDVIVRTLSAIVASNIDHEQMLQSEDIREVVAYAVAETRRLMLRGDGDKGGILLDLVEQLPAAAIKNFKLCLALRSVFRGDTLDGQRLLREEIGDWPENDVARAFLSNLVLGRDIVLRGDHI